MTDYSKCGTMQGLYVHRKLHEPLCDACRRAQNDYGLERYHKVIKVNRKCPKGHALVRLFKNRRLCIECYEFNPDKCGTLAGCAQHSRFKQKICDACRRARQDYETRGGTCKKCKTQFDKVDSTGRRYCGTCRVAKRKSPVERAKPHSKNWWYEEYTDLVDMGCSTREICRALKVDESTLKRMLQERKRIR